MARKVTKVYDKTTRKWSTKIVEVPDKASPSTGSKKSTASTTGNTSSATQKKTPATTTKKVTDRKSSKGKATKKTKKKEYYTLSGSLSVLPTTENIKIAPGQTISLQGLGRWLTGKYYVASVTRTIDSNGFKETLEVFKPNFRKSLKKKVSTKKKSKSKSKNKDNVSAEEVSGSDVIKAIEIHNSDSKKKRLVKEKPRISQRLVKASVNGTEVERNKVRTYTISSKGDTLWNIAKRFYGDSSKWEKLYYYSSGEKPDPLNLILGAKVVIP